MKKHRCDDMVYGVLKETEADFKAYHLAMLQRYISLKVVFDKYSLSSTTEAKVLGCAIKSHYVPGKYIIPSLECGPSKR